MQAIQYKQRIRDVLTAAAADARGNSELRQGAAAALEAFQPLMTLYLTDKTSTSQVPSAALVFPPDDWQDTGIT